MKTTFQKSLYRFSLLCFLSFPGFSFLNAQAFFPFHYKKAQKIEPELFARPYVQCQYYSYKAQDGTFDLEFPYTTFTGNSSAAHIFSVSKSNLTGSGKFAFAPGVEIGYGRFSADVNMNFLSGPVWGWTDNFYFGINYRFASPLLFLQPGDIKLASVAYAFAPPEDYNPWRLRLKVGIQYYHPLYWLGNIEVGEGEHFYAAGYTLPDRDTAVNRAGTTHVYFQQNTISLVPAFELGYQPYHHHVDFAFSIAPLILLSQEGGLRFIYRNGDVTGLAPGGYNLHYINLRTDGVEASYNGERISSTPFRLNGFVLSFRLGFYFGD